MSNPHVFFIRGLSTDGSDDAYFSIFRFGPMARQFAGELGARGIEFHAVNGMGDGDLLTLARRCRDILERNPVWRDPNIPVHIFGHSAGGLVARLLAAQTDLPAGKIKSVITVACPNSGSVFADHCLAIPRNFPWSARLLKLFGYDFGAKGDGIRNISTAVVRPLMQEHGVVPAPIRQASIICWAQRRDWCWPLRLFYIIPCFNAFPLPTDGIVERDSQAFGEIIGEIHIDHFRQIGILGKREKFKLLCATLAEFFKR